MKIMPVKFVPIKNQKFDLRNVIQPTLCDCSSCDFKNCPKHNYCVKCYSYKYSPEEFFEFYKYELLNLIVSNERVMYSNPYRPKLINWTPDLLNSFIMECIKFPKHRYFEVDIDTQYIYIYKKTKTRDPYKIMKIDYINNGYFYAPNRYGDDYKLLDEKLAEQILYKYMELKRLILFYEENKNE